MNLNSPSSYCKFFQTIATRQTEFFQKITPINRQIIGLSALVATIAVTLFLIIRHFCCKAKKSDLKIVDSSKKLSDEKKSGVITPTQLDANTPTQLDANTPIHSDANESSPKLVKEDISTPKTKDSVSTQKVVSGQADQIFKNDQKSPIISESPLVLPVILPSQKIITSLLKETKEPVLKAIRPLNMIDLRNLIELSKGTEGLEIFLPKVDLAEKTLTLDIFSEIAKHCPNLKNLSLIANDDNGFALNLGCGFASLSSLKNLKALTLVNISADKFNVAQNQNLETLEIKDCIFTEFPSEMSNLGKLQNLSLVQNLFDENLKYDDLNTAYSSLLLGLKSSLKNIKLQDYRLQNLPQAFEGENFASFAELKELDLKGNPFSVDPEFKIKRQDQMIHFDLISQSSPGLVNEGQNVLVIGRTRSGKSTLMNVLTNNLNTKHPSIFSETKGSNLSSIKFQGLFVDQNQAQINFHDTPGLFELRKTGDKSRANNQLLEMIRNDYEKFFGGIGFGKVDHLFFTISTFSGIKKEDLDSFEIGLPFLRRMGLPKDVQISLVITRSEGFDKRQRDKIINELESHISTKDFLTNNSVKILFTGGVDINLITNGLDEDVAVQEKSIRKYRKVMLNKIFGKVKNFTVSKKSACSYDAQVQQIVNGGLI